MQAETDRKEALDDRVVQVTGDSLAVLDRRKLGDPGMQAGVLDGDAGCRRQSIRELLVDIGEHVATGLVAQVQVAEDLAAHGDRHAEERGHRRMIRRKAEAVGMLAEVG